jgi:hypothetical protein
LHGERIGLIDFSYNVKGRKVWPRRLTFSYLRLTVTSSFELTTVSFLFSNISIYSNSLTSNHASNYSCYIYSFIHTIHFLLLLLLLFILGERILSQKTCNIHSFIPIELTSWARPN